MKQLEAYKCSKEFETVLFENNINNTNIPKHVLNNKNIMF